MTVRVRPITDAEVRPVACFLNVHLNERVMPETWMRAMDPPWHVDAPNRGFFLHDDSTGGDGVVGAYLAFYSQRLIDGRAEKFCNLGAWCVLPSHRFHSLRLLRAMLAQEGYHFTDLSPSGNVVELNKRMDFQFLDTTTVLLPNLPWPSWSGRGTVSADPTLIERTLTGAELQLYRDHAAAAAARHLVLLKDCESCWVMFRKDRRKNLPLFASILHVSNPGLFRAMARPVASYLLVRHGALATLAELAVVAHRPRLSLVQRSPRRKMFRSPHLHPEQIDYLYSELVCVPW